MDASVGARARDVAASKQVIEEETALAETWAAYWRMGHIEERWTARMTGPSKAAPVSD